jgi:hypothetical protein
MGDDTNPPAPKPDSEGPGTNPSTRPEPVNVAFVKMTSENTPDPSTISTAADTGAPSSAPVLPQETGDPQIQLAAMAREGNQTRLAPADEDRATRLMKDCILQGSAGIASALEAMPQLPWILAVRAIETAWPDLPAESRAQVIEGLGKIDTEAGYRLRLSIARGLARQELPIAIRVAADACRAMWNHDNASLTPEHSKLIGNVFIGRGKPWILQLPLADLPEADATAVLSCVVFSAFNINNPPITQLSILRYAGPRLAGLHENLLAMIVRAVSRWTGRWQSALQKEILNLPEPILAALKAERAPEPRPPAGGRRPAQQETEPSAEPEAPIPPELEEKLLAAGESGDPAAVEAVTQEINAWREAQRLARLDALDEDEDDEEEIEDEETGPTDEPQARQGRRGRDRRDRPAYVSREQEARGGSTFNYSAAMKQLDHYVSGLRNELVATQARLRRAEDDARRGRKESADRPVLSHEEASLSPDELRRLVTQLETRSAELKARVEELTADSEARGLAMAAGTAEAPPDAATQLRTLLALKLQEDFSDFLALEKESPDLVVQQHYRGLIRHVFQILTGEGVPLRVPEEPVIVRPLPPQIPE